MVLQYRIEQSKKEDMQNTIVSLRKAKVSETTIFNTLVDTYGNAFSKEQIKKFMAKSK